MPKKKLVKDIGEFGLINRILKHREIVFDDAGEIDFPAKNKLLITCDSLIEDVHFTRNHPPFMLGYKAVSVNLSDIAAMAGIPVCAVISLGLPENLPIKFIDEFYRGVDKCCGEFGLKLLGGNTFFSPRKIFIDAAVIGACESKKTIRRKGARPGDYLLCTGYLGLASSGRDSIKNGYAGCKTARKRFLMPVPRINEARKLYGFATSLMDISDGLSGDIRHLASRSKVGFCIWQDRLPISPETRAISRKTGKNELNYALHGGEDYELLFTVPMEKVETVIQKIRGVSKVVVSVIGRAVPGKKISMIDPAGRIKETGSGYEHFR